MTQTDIQSHPLWHRILTYTIVAINILLSVGLILSAYSEMVPPAQNKYAVAMVMTFPFWLAAIVAIFIIDLIWWRRSAMIAGVAMIICTPQIRAFSPMNFPVKTMSAALKARSFTIMTYNTLQFIDQQNPDGNTTNPQLDYIMAMRPDIVCIQEAEYLLPTIRNSITEDQIYALQQMYPYIFTTKELSFLSKFPAEVLPINFPAEQFKSGNLAGYRVVIDSEIINIFSVHLRSLAFSKEQRSLFKNIVDGEDIRKDDLKEAKSELLSPLLKAALERAEQIKLLNGYIRKFGGPNVIVCGDFNDPVGSYALYYLSSESDLRQVYADVGFGPTITYNANNFYFRIDHILYRGNLKPYSIERGDLKASDHYPLTATFTIPDSTSGN